MTKRFNREIGRTLKTFFRKFSDVLRRKNLDSFD